MTGILFATPGLSNEQLLNRQFEGILGLFYLHPISIGLVKNFCGLFVAPMAVKTWNLCNHLFQPFPPFLFALQCELFFIGIADTMPAI